LFEIFSQLRQVQIGRYLKVTLAYRGLYCKYSDNIVVWTVYPAATCSDWKLPESNP